MIVSGLGTKDSPILLDDDSESEVITELIGTPSSCLAHPEDPDFTPRLSPRPGTFLSNVARLNLSKSSAQTLKKYRQDLRQSTHGLKRKRAPTPSEENGGPYPSRGQLSTANIVVEVVADSVKRESEVRHQLPNPPEKLSQSGIGPLAKKPKHTHKPINERIAVPDRLPLATLKESTTSKTSSALGPTSCPNAPWPHSRFPDSIALPPSMISTSYQFDHTPLPLPFPTPDLFTGQFMPMTQEPFPVMNMDFDPMFWAMSMSMNGFAMSSAPIPPIGIPLPPKPTVSQKQQSTLPLPPSKSSSSVKSEPKHQLASSMSSPKLDTAISEHLPARPPHSNDKPSLPRHKAFTLRPTDRSMTASTYLPIGKPDFRDIHGVFPIVPSLMFPAPSGAAAPYTPDLDRTLVLENLTKSYSKVWIQNWCLKACGSLPELFLVGPRRALVVFKQAEHAIEAWASPKLGVDESGFRIMGAVGESRTREDVITAYWYRPDAVMERQLVKSWASSKKMISEMKEMLAISMDESIIAKALTERYKEMLELSQVQEEVQTAEPRVVLQRMAAEMGFHERLAQMLEMACTEEDVSKWEQKEIALLERERRRQSLFRYRTRHSEERKVGGEEKKKKPEGKKNTLRSMNAQPVPAFASHQNQRNAPSASTSGTAPTKVVGGPGSVSKPSLVSSSSIRPARPQPLQQPQLSSSSSASGGIPPEKPELRFGQTAWKKPDFTISSSSQPQETHIHPNHPALVNQSEQRASNLSASPAAGTSTKLPPALHPSPLPSTLRAKPKLPGMPSCDVTTPPLSSPGKAELRFGQTAWNLPTNYSIVSSPTKEKPPLHPPPVFPARSMLGDRKYIAEPQERSQTVPSDIPAYTPTPVGVDKSPAVIVATTSETQANETSAITNLRIPAAGGSPKPLDSSGLVKPQLPMESTSVPVATSESVSNLKTGKAVASTSTGSPASSPLTSTAVMAAAPGFGQGTTVRVQMSDTITDQSVTVKAESAATPTPQLTLVSAPRPPPVIPLRMLQRLRRVLAKSTEERQKFLDNEFKATRLLMDRLMTITCKIERKQVTDLWKQKIRIMDEVTRSIRNEAKVWYSQEMKTWIRMRWPDCLDTAGMLVIEDED